MVESQPSKLLVAGSIPVSRSSLRSLLESGTRASAGKPADARHRLVHRSAKREGGSAPRRWKRAAKVESAKADVAQLAERVLGKDEVTSSILVIGSSLRA